MNRFRMSWQHRCIPKVLRPGFDPQQYTYTVWTGPILPALPRELWRKIMAFVVRLAGSDAVDLDDPFSTPYENEEYPEIDPGLFEDRRSMMLVSSQWRADVREISCGYLTIYSANELEFLVKLFEDSKANHRSGKRLGEWTLRIDFKILGPYNVPHVIRLLKCTPNILIYNNKNGPADFPERYAPPEVLSALVTYCSHSLRRIEWSGAGESPRFEDLVVLCNSLPHLRTLRLVAVHSFPLPGQPLPPLTLPCLHTLALGTIPRPFVYLPEFAQTWDVLLSYLCYSPQQLPSLRRLECELFPMHSPAFFHMHGFKLRLFRTGSFSGGALPGALGLSPNLDTLVLAHGSEEVALPAFHPSLARICITPNIDVAVDMPQRFLHVAVIGPLEALLKALETVVAPCLREVRVWNLGAYSSLSEYGLLFGILWRRWNIRGVRFCDKNGQAYKDIVDSEYFRVLPFRRHC